MTKFSEADVLAMAKAISEDPIEYREQNRGPEYSCFFCCADGWEQNTVTHNTDCPVLIARDVLTT